MDDFGLRAGEDHIERLAHEGDPVPALIELVWNAIDAEATTVRIALDRDDANWADITARPRDRRRPDRADPMSATSIAPP